MRYLACLLLFSLLALPGQVKAYELSIIYSVSNTGRSFVTRTGKKDGIFVGKKSTFTANNISLIARAVSVTREFTQWRIENSKTAIPFSKGQVVTMYDTTEYLWALSPEEVKSKYIKSKLFTPRSSLSAHMGLFTGLSSSVSGTEPTSDQRGGLVFEGIFENELNKNFALAAGMRYSREIISVAAASLTTNQVLGIAEIRYYFDKIPSFYNSRIGLGLGAGFGQSQTVYTDSSSSGFVTLLPVTRASLNVPLNKLNELVVEGAFESARSDEDFENGESQSTNTSNFRYGIAFKRFLD